MNHHEHHPIYGKICCHCGCPISYRPRSLAPSIPVCSCDYEPFRVGVFAKPSNCNVSRVCGICRKPNCKGCQGHYHSGRKHHILNPKRVPLPQPIFEAMTVLVYHQGWQHRDLFVELTAPVLNPALTLTNEIVTLYGWVNEKGKVNERFDLILRAFDNGFYLEMTPEQQLYELFKRYNKLEEPYRTNAFNVAREVLAIYHIDCPII